MKNKVVNVTSSNLNAGLVEVDMRLSYTISDYEGTTKTLYLYPKEIYMYNGSGDIIEYNFIKNEEEWQEYQEDSSPFALLEVANGSALSDENSLVKSYKMILKSKNGTAGSDVRIEFINLKP